MAFKKEVSEEQIEKVLANFSIRKTPLRREILRFFLSSNYAATQADLLNALIKSLPDVDRVSLYRNLKGLKNHGIIHEVEVNSYIACEHDCGKHPHLLLYCYGCGRHEEIKDHSKISKMLEALSIFNFFSDQKSVSLRGTCRKCV